MSDWNSLPMSADKEETLDYLKVLNAAREKVLNPKGYDRTAPNNAMPSMAQISLSMKAVESDIDIRDFEDVLRAFRAASFTEDSKEKMLFEEALFSNRIEQLYGNDLHQSLIERLKLLFSLSGVEYTPEFIPSLMNDIIHKPGIRRRGPLVTRLVAGGIVAYTPPDSRSVILRLLRDWSSFNQAGASASGLSLPLFLALSHYQYVSIHPLYDGNGRSGRAFMLDMFMKSLSVTALPMLSKALLGRKEEYFRMLDAPRLQGDFAKPGQFFTDILTEAMEFTLALYE